MTEKFENLVRWVEENGGYIDKDIYLHVYENGDRCLKTKKYKDDKEVLFRIPCECYIQGKSWYEVSVKLLGEFSKGKDSFYYPYLCMLPSISNFKNHPLFKYNEDEIAIIAKLNKECARLLQDCYKRIFTLEQIVKNLILPEYFKNREILKYVICLCNTRFFGTSGLIPIVDMLQHVQQKESCNVIIQIQEETIVDNMYKLNPEDSLTFCYRPGSMADLYITYGIPILDINYISVCLTFPDITEKQKKLLEGSNVTFYFSDHGIDAVTLRKARILNDEYDDNLIANKKAIHLLTQVLNLSFEEEYPISNDRYKIFHDITAKQNEIIRKSMEDFQSIKNL